MKLYREFFSYVIPSLLAFALSGVYSIVDGFFVGNSIGDAGLTTINIAYPVVALLQAAGTGIGMGGAVHYSIRLASGKKEEAKCYTDGTVVLLLAASLVSTLVFYLAAPAVLTALGASGQILELGISYLRIIVLGSVFQIFGTGLVPLIRNMGGAFYAMMIMVAGFLTNIVLDYVFVWLLHEGVAGAALATLIGQAVTMAGGLLFFLRRGVSFHLVRSVFSRERVKGLLTGILKIGLSPFGITFSPNITIILMNRFLMDYGGEKATACYACIVYRLPAASGRGRRLPATHQQILRGKPSEKYEEGVQPCLHKRRLHSSRLHGPHLPWPVSDRRTLRGLGPGPRRGRPGASLLPRQPHFPGPCAGHHLRLLRHGEDAPVLHPGVRGAGIPLPAPSSAAKDGRAQRRVAEYSSCPVADFCDSACL